MLEKFLPKILKPKQNPSQQEQDPSLNSSANLLQSYEAGFFEGIDFVRRATLLLKIFIVVLPLIFIYTLFLNDIADRRINYTEDTLVNVNNELLVYKDVEHQMARIIGKTDVYKNSKAESFSFAKPTELVISKIPPSVTLNEMHESPKEITIGVSATSALDFPILISKYLTDPTVSEIVLESAELNVEDNKYEVVMSLIFKSYVQD